MTDKPQKLTAGDFAHHEVQEYKEPGVPRWLLILYIILPIWGFYTLYTYWDGSQGCLDRWYWEELQVASNTTRNKVFKAGVVARGVEETADTE